MDERFHNFFSREHRISRVSAFCLHSLSPAEISDKRTRYQCRCAGLFRSRIRCFYRRGDVKCPWVIVGHSERRQYHGETNEIVAAKAKIAIEHGLRPIVCVGETLEERESGRTSDVVIGQLNAVLDAIGPEALVTGAVAYEPVWAIGTGKTATPQQAQLVHAELRDSVESRDSQAASALRIIYGGSVKPSNAAELFACNDIDGGLVGGASLKAADFYAIAQAASGIGLI